MRKGNDDILEDVAHYYSRKLHQFGMTPQGVDWNGEAGQLLRFGQLARVITREEFSINDLGCGYGALYAFLKERFPSFSYFGWDISPDMVASAQGSHEGIENALFKCGATPNPADYGVASGIFNVRLDCEIDAWESYIHDTLDTLFDTSLGGFAFNCLTSYSDTEKQRQDLYYADPCKLFDWCKRRYSRQVALLHDYGLYEFTILVRKEL